MRLAIFALLAAGSAVAAPTSLGYGLRLDKAAAGRLASAGGIASPASSRKPQPIVMTFGASAPPGVLQWMADSFARKGLRRNGVILAHDLHLKETSRLTFTDALVTEIGFPALSAGSKGAALLTLKVRAEAARQTTTSPPATVKYKSGGQKKWSPSNFRVTVEGLDCTKIGKVDALTFKMKTVERSGPAGAFKLEPGSIEVPNLVITLPESIGDAWLKWHKQVVLSGEQIEKTVKLEYLAPDLRTLYFTLLFEDTTPIAITKVPGPRPQLKVTLHVKRVKLDYPP